MGDFHPNRWQGANENNWIGKLEPYQILEQVRDKTQSLCHLPRSTSWRDRYSSTSSVLFKRHGILSRTRPLTIPPFAFSLFRKCVFYAPIMHYYINRRVKYLLDGCSSWVGMLFQLNWNTVPTYLEQESNLAVTRRKQKKLTTRAYRVRRERWCLEGGRVSCWRW